MVSQCYRFETSSSTANKKDSGKTYERGRQGYALDIKSRTAVITF